MQSKQIPMNIDQPTFVTEKRGGFSEWDTERTVLVGVALPSGEELRINDEVEVDVGAAPVDIDADDETITAVVEMGSVVEGRQVEVENNTPPWFSVLLDESEFREAWGGWLRSPPPSD